MIKKIFSLICVFSILTGCSSTIDDPGLKVLWAIAPKYEYASCFFNEIAVVGTSGGFYMFIDDSGNRMFNRDFFSVSIKNDGIGMFTDTLPTVKETPDGIAYQIQKDGLQAPNPLYPIVIQDELNRQYHIAKSSNGFVGLVDNKSQWIIAPQFDELKFADKDQLQFRKGEQIGFINDSGEPVIVPGAGIIKTFQHGYALVYLNSFSGMPEWSEHSWYNFIDMDGNYVLDYPLSECPIGMSEGIITYCQNSLYGFRNVDSNVIIPPIYSYAGVFSDGLAFVQNSDGEIGYIDYAGNLVIPFQKGQYGGEFENGIAPVTAVNGKIGLINSSGEWLTSAKYNSAIYDSEQNVWELEGKSTDIYFVDADVLVESFSLVTEILPGSVIGYKGLENKMALTNINNGKAKWHYFNYVGSFSEGLATAKKDGLYGYIDTNGNWIYSPQFEDAKPFSENKAAVCLDGKWGYILNPILSK